MNRKCERLELISFCLFTSNPSQIVGLIRLLLARRAISTTSLRAPGSQSGSAGDDASAPLVKGGEFSDCRGGPASLDSDVSPVESPTSSMSLLDGFSCRPSISGNVEADGA